jgi:ClpP class serine protease
VKQHAIVSVSPLFNLSALSVKMQKAEELLRNTKAEMLAPISEQYDALIDGGLDAEGYAIINIQGEIYETSPLFALWCDFAVPSVIGKIVKQYESDNACKGFRFVFNTGGGSISTVPELADVIFNLSKPSIAEIHENCCSAGYWLASQCDTLIATRGATVGALGVYIAIYDYSKMLEKEGVKAHLISTAELKGMGTFGVELTEDQIDFLKAYVKRSGEMFLADIKCKRPAFNEKLFSGAF